MTPLRVFVGIDMVHKWPPLQRALSKLLDCYLYAHLCNMLGQKRTDELYDEGWGPEVSIDDNYFVVELVFPEEVK